MTQTVLLKRSATPSKIPATTDLALGEIGINTYDGKVYIKKDNGTASIVQIGGGSSSVGSSFTNVNSSFTAVAGTAYLVDTTVNTITITLPASPTANDTIILVDYLQNSQTNNITISRNGNKINNLSEDLIIDYNGITVQLTYYSGNWVITNTGGINNAGYVQTTEYTATAGQALFSVTYPSASALMVFVNGVQFSLAAGDYSASNGTSVTLANALSAGDLVKFVTFNNIGNYPTVSSSEFTATAGQTTFPFTYNASSGISGLQVFKNGIQLSSSQYTASNGTSVILGTACAVNDKIRLMGIQAATTSTGFNPWASPALTGTATAPTVSTGDSSTNIATTAFVQTALTQSGALAGMRNRVINGNANIAQRGTTFTVTPGLTTYYGGPDRFYATLGASAGGQFTQSQGSLVYGGVTKNTVRQTVNTASSNLAGSGNAYLWGGIQHRIEGYQVYDLLGQTVTISFIFNTNVIGTYSISLVDGGTSNSYISTFNIAAANTPTKISLTATLPVSLSIPNSSAIGFFIQIGSLNTATYSTSTLNTWASGNFITASTQTNWSTTAANFIELTELQLEAGAVATPYEFRPFQTELALCQRYYETSYDIGTAPGTAVVNGAPWFYISGPAGLNGNTIMWKHSVTKRVVPTMTFYSPATGAAGKVRDTVNSAELTPSLQSLGMSGGSAQVIVTASSYTIVEGHWTASAEL